MKRKWIAILMALALAVTLAACGAGKETTLTGMVVSVDGTVISLMEMDTADMGSMDFAEGQQPEMPEGMEGFQGFGNFDPEDFEGAFPEGGNFSPWGDGEMPEGMELPEGMTIPEGMELPEGMEIPEDGQMPGFGGMGGMDFGNFDADVETTDVDISDAHISVQIDGGKASGSMEDIQAGTFVTITMNGKGKATNVLVSSQSFFGGGFRGANGT